MITLFHTFSRCIRGWSHLSITTIDIRKVEVIEYRQRLFCIIDRDYPYTVCIRYTNQYSVRQPFSLITKRYETLEDAEFDVNEINRKIEVLKKFDREQANRLDDMSK
jgi:hypothetical protein